MSPLFIAAFEILLEYESEQPNIFHLKPQAYYAPGDACTIQAVQ